MDQQLKQSGSYTAPPALFKARTRTIIVTTLIIFAFLVLGSYMFRWNWTGFDHNTLFQWLKLLLVPVVVVTAPAWFSSHPRIQARWNMVFIASLLLLVVLLLASFAFQWNWTGFRGATLWDWLNLLLLPLALTALMVWASIKPVWRPQWTALTVVILLAFAITIFGGYAFNWKWTGFHGNTLWDWLNLLVLPFVLPAVILWFSALQSRPGAGAGASPAMPVTPASTNPGAAYQGMRAAQSPPPPFQGGAPRPAQTPQPPFPSASARTVQAENKQQESLADEADDGETVHLSQRWYLREEKDETE